MKKIFYVKKRGFTLIELLAVIVILAIILLIAMPIVLNVIGESRKGAFEASAMGLVKTAENECLTARLNKEQRARLLTFPEDEDQLYFSGEGPDGGQIRVLNSCRVEIAIHKGDWCARKTADEREVTLTPYDGECALPSEIGNGDELDGYSEEEIDDLIYNRLYIPVANADELNQMRDEEINWFGAGTKWYGEYEGGLDEKRYIQVADIDLSSYANWVPLPWFYESVYDGNKFQIANLNIDSDNWAIGLFEYIYGNNELRNITLVDSLITSDCSWCYVGSLVGLLNDSSIRNCHAINTTIDAAATSTSWIGGLVGAVEYGSSFSSLDGYSKIVDSASRNLTLNGGAYPGGLVGYVSGNLVMERNYCTGNIVSEDTHNGSAGGLVAEIYSNEGDFYINDSYSRCNITYDGMYVGGLVGNLYLSTNIYHEYVIKNSYVAALVESTEALYPDIGDYYVGGIAALMSYWGPNETMTGATYYDKDLAQSDGYVSSDGFPGGNTYRSEFIGKLEHAFLPGTLSLAASHGLPSWSDTGLKPREVKFSRSANCYFRENLGVVSAGSGWQPVTVANPPFPNNMNTSSLYVYFDDVLSPHQDNNYTINSHEDGELYIRQSGVNKTVTIDYCKHGATQSLSYQKHPDWFGYPKETSAMKNQSTFEGWDFSNVWAINPSINNGYPHLRRANAFAREVLEDYHECFKFDSTYQIIYGYNSSCATPTTIPAQINGIDVLHIGTRAFSGEGISSLTLPEGLLTIGNGAFRNNGSLTSLVIPNSVVSIGREAFRNNGINNLTIGDNVRSIEAQAFWGNNLNNLTIPDGIVEIGWAAFRDNSINSLTLPTSLLKIDEYAFYGNSLSGVSLPENLIHIGGMSFANNSISSLTIPENVEFIGWSAFQSNNLTEVLIPNSVGNLEAGSFQQNRITAGNALIDNDLDSVNGFQFAFRLNGNFRNTHIHPTFLR